MLVDHKNPILHKASEQVGQNLLAENARGLKPYIQLLLDQLYKHNALGISACQIGVDLAVFAIDVDNILRVCANPQIVAASSDMHKSPEGCLSFPRLQLKVNRPAAVIARYINADGVEVTEELEGLTARAWLHEYDHTIGICFTDRVSKLSLDMARKKQEKFLRRKAT